MDRRGRGGPTVALLREEGRRAVLGVGVLLSWGGGLSLGGAIEGLLGWELDIEMVVMEGALTRDLKRML